MNKVIIVRGIPGSGKSTMAKEVINLAKEDNVSTKYYSADLFFMKTGEYVFDKRLIGNAHIYCMSQFLYGLQNGVGLVVVDNTHTSCWEYTPYMQVAQAYGYNVEILQVECDQEVAFKRQTHNVPAKQHEAMSERFQQVLPHHKQFLTVKQNT